MPVENNTHAEKDESASNNAEANNDESKVKSLLKVLCTPKLVCC